MNDGYLPTDTAKGELIQIPITIDAANPIILINYAAVMEANNHYGIYDANQTNCGFRIVDAESGGTKYFSELFHYSAKESSILNWKSFNNPDRKNVRTVWKDWSKVGVDLSALSGKDVVLVLYSYDCALSGLSNKQAKICEDHHESHLYAHITCAPKELVFHKDCEGTEDNITITAPEGFSYRWYEKSNKGKKLSEERTLHMPAADVDATYVCELTNHVGTFELEQLVKAPEPIEYGEQEADRGKPYIWKIKTDDGVIDSICTKTDDYWYNELFKGDPQYSDACIKKIHHIHVTANPIICLGQFAVNGFGIKDSVCGDARGINIAYRYKEYKDELTDPNNPLVIHPSVERVSVDFEDKWNSQGYKDTTIAVNGTTMEGIFTIPMPYDSAVYEKTGEYIYSYPRPDDYSMTLSVQNTCGPERDTILHFTVYYPFWVIYQRWNDILSIHNETYNGGNPIANVRWFRNKQEVVGRGEHHSYIHVPDLVTNIDSYYAELTRSDDRKTFCTCRFTPQYNSADDKPVFKGEGIDMAPRRGDNRQLQVLTVTSGAYTIYDMTGRAVQQGNYGEAYGSPDITINPSVARGTYIIYFRADDGMQTTKKWIVE